MATWSKSCITDAGLELLEQAVSGGGVTITRAGLGSGTVSDELLTAQTALSAPLTTVTCLIASQKQLEGSSGLEIKLQIRNTGLLESKTFRQAGLFAKAGDGDEVLFAVAQDSGGEEIPSEAEYPDFLEEFTAIAAFTNTGNVTVKVSSLVYVTREEMEAELLKIPRIVSINSSALGDAIKGGTADKTALYAITDYKSGDFDTSSDESFITAEDLEKILNGG